MASKLKGNNHSNRNTSERMVCLKLTGFQLISPGLSKLR